MSPEDLRILTSIAVIGFLILIVILAAIFQPKGPEVVATSTTLQRIEIGLPIVKFNMTMGVDVLVKNRSYAGFQYGNSATVVYYHGVFVGQAPIKAGFIPGHATQNISTVVEIIASKVISHPRFLQEFESGSLNFTSLSSVEGSGTVLVILKLHASITVRCDITTFVLTRKIRSNCNSIVKT